MSANGKIIKIREEAGSDNEHVKYTVWFEPIPNEEEIVNVDVSDQPFDITGSDLLDDIGGRLEIDWL